LFCDRCFQLVEIFLVALFDLSNFLGLLLVLFDHCLVFLLEGGDYFLGFLDDFLNFSSVLLPTSQSSS
jgi:hypothetical protein